MSVRREVQGIVFEWDANKADLNQRKHGVTFEMACEAFFDPFLRIVDAGLGQPEARQAVIGLDTSWHLLFVVFVEFETGIRIVSARAATAAERRTYEAE